MAAAAVNTNPPQSETSSEKHKPNHASSPSIASKAEVNGSDSQEHQHFKELQKSLRNAMKKLNATAKVDAIIAENPGKSLDELVAEKKINVDQKAQALKKPSLQAAVAQIEEQIAQFKSFAAYYEERLVSQKAELEKAHKEQLEAVQKQATEAASGVRETELRQKLLNLSKFLCAAARVRNSGDETSNESRAFEGVLYQIYGGTQDAVSSMLKIIDGVDEKVVGVDSTLLDVTYGRVKQAAAELAGPTDETTTATTEAAPQSDPTIANAGYTELQDSSYNTDATATVTTESATAAEPEAEQVQPPAQTLVGEGANAVAEANWDANASGVSSANTEGWVEVPRDPAETDTGLEATPAAAQAEVKGSATAEHGSENVTVPKDGFEQVHHHQRQPSVRGRGRGGHGRGRGDGFRGRGRGEFRGHGRGRGRGGRGRGGANANGNGAPSAAPAGNHTPQGRRGPDAGTLPHAWHWALSMLHLYIFPVFILAAVGALCFPLSILSHTNKLMGNGGVMVDESNDS
ncbi:uncharacterized protein BO96DRAFT_385000 [Aspergillus niger CBS 101883]|uniref:Contig An07c0370, genomic contig n=3 Tax=Aspergillus niger TaxID=5061 RepID=A2QPL2_ASPNC|nr:uncharacterized protein BO96DRAFT_385000 [Aspergillus niger CBS 101883]XP_059601108.1 uncharacterized protein An07g09830 [Aspergillus niger]PYH60663.1 hypothetical protein BO96DRAFT_385000 [Aspergillus niger CBS 101883]RDH15255.1 hypothetical protein M747DRAFT_326222 [Aspergillus niger ATCC 13496]CAK39749.1 unnamed protein product [Aspergillus niger]